MKSAIVEKGVPAGWITKDGSDVSDELSVCETAIQGEVQVPQQDGLRCCIQEVNGQRN